MKQAKKEQKEKKEREERERKEREERERKEREKREEKERRDKEREQKEERDREAKEKEERERQRKAREEQQRQKGQKQKEAEEKEREEKEKGLLNKKNQKEVSDTLLQNHSRHVQAVEETSKRMDDSLAEYQKGFSRSARQQEEFFVQVLNRLEIQHTEFVDLMTKKIKRDSYVE